MAGARADRGTRGRVEKRDLCRRCFTEADLNQQIRVKMRVSNPDPSAFNPGKVLQQLHCCAELGRMHIHRGQYAGFPTFQGLEIVCKGIFGLLSLCKMLVEKTMTKLTVRPRGR